MAEIHVEKKGTNIWAWVIGLIVLALLVWAAMAAFDEDEPLEQDAAGVVAPAPMGDEVGRGELYPPQVEQYMGWVNRTEAEQAAGLDHRYVATGFRQLADAMRAVAEREPENTQLQEHIRTLDAAAERLVQSGEQVMRHADWARDAATSAVDAMAAMKRAQMPDANALIDPVREAARRIDPAQPLTNQTGALQDFFTRSRDVMKTLAVV